MWYWLIISAASRRDHSCDPSFDFEKGERKMNMTSGSCYCHVYHHHCYFCPEIHYRERELISALSWASGE